MERLCTWFNLTEDFLDCQLTKYITQTKLKKNQKLNKKHNVQVTSIEQLGLSKENSYWF